MSDPKLESHDPPLLVTINREANNDAHVFGEIEKAEDVAFSETEDKEWRHILRKLDLYLMPQLFFLSMFTAIVRSNIGKQEISFLLHRISYCS